MTFSSDLKMSATKYYLGGGGSLKEVSELFGCSKQALYTWIKQLKETGELKSKSRVCSSYKIRKVLFPFWLNDRPFSDLS